MYIIYYTIKQTGMAIITTVAQEEFEDTKWVIRIRISKDRQDNDQKKKGKRANNDLQNTTH
jgi:hypothetical protein